MNDIGKPRPVPGVRAQRIDAAEHAASSGAIMLRAAFDRLFHAPTIGLSDLLQVRAVLEHARAADAGTARPVFAAKPADAVAALERLEAAVTKEMRAQPIVDALEMAHGRAAVDDDLYARLTSGAVTLQTVQELAQAAEAATGDAQRALRGVEHALAQVATQDPGLKTALIFALAGPGAVEPSEIEKPGKRAAMLLLAAGACAAVAALVVAVAGGGLEHAAHVVQNPQENPLAWGAAVLCAWRALVNAGASLQLTFRDARG